MNRLNTLNRSPRTKRVHPVKSPIQLCEPDTRSVRPVSGCGRSTVPRITSRSGLVPAWSVDLSSLISDQMTMLTVVCEC